MKTDPDKALSYIRENKTEIQHNYNDDFVVDEIRNAETDETLYEEGMC